MAIRAALFDFGGVIIDGPFEFFSRYERANDLPPGLIRQINSTNPDTNAWARLERGELDRETFATAFESEAEALGFRVDATEILAGLSGAIRPEMVAAVRRCSERLKTALVSNNFDASASESLYPPDVLDLFDLVVESSKVGVRKPEPGIYTFTCRQLSIEPSEAVFLDDLGVNLKPARAMGITTIKVTDPAAAIAELERVVGFSLQP